MFLSMLSAECAPSCPETAETFGSSPFFPIIRMIRTCKKRDTGVSYTPFRLADPDLRRHLRESRIAMLPIQSFKMKVNFTRTEVEMAQPGKA